VTVQDLDDVDRVGGQLAHVLAGGDHSLEAE
jgi:hypothetical protein